MLYISFILFILSIHRRCSSIRYPVEKRFWKSSNSCF